MDTHGQQFYERLIEQYPHWSEYLCSGPCDELSQIGVSSEHPRLHIPSEHPSISAPLTIELGGTFQVYWYAGYFTDFLGYDRPAVEEALDFFSRFQAEEVQYSVFRCGRNIIAGGPVEGDDWREMAEESTGWFRLEIRSWRGTHDVDVLPEDLI